jgi:hypothetical protein
MLAASTDRIVAMHRSQVHRAPWPDSDAFDPAGYSFERRRAAAVQWAGRARAEHGSVHQFSLVAHVACDARLELDVLGALARLITDEVRHAELCMRMAVAYDPEGPAERAHVFRWPAPQLPWPPAPRPDAPAADRLQWIAEAVLIACCIGETLSRPMLEAIATVATEPLAEEVARQILRDEHLHATFGWETLTTLLPRLSDEHRRRLEAQLSASLAGFEASTTCGISVDELANTELAIERGSTNLGTLTDRQYAMIFYATLEHEVFPKLRALGLHVDRAWAGRRLREAR